MVRSPVNFRAFIVVALSVTAAVFCAYAYVFSRAAGIACGCALAAALLCVTVVSALACKRGKIRLRIVIAFAIATVLSVSAFSFALATIEDWRESNRYGGGHAVTGRVCAVDIGTGDYRFVLENVAFDGVRVDGSMRIRIAPSDRNIGDFLECGDTLDFYANVSSAKLVDGGKVDGHAFRTDIRYIATVSTDDIYVHFGKPTALESFRANLRELYITNMGDKYGNIAFSMVTGDKYGLDSRVVDYFSASGLGHIMAVSGLHIGFLAVVLNFALCKLGKKARFPIVLAVLIAYNVVADFSPSVIRATIMAAVSGAALYFGGRRDLLSSLLCAFSVILAFKPLYLFEAGFLLSFGAIFGIALFANTIRRLLVKKGAADKLSNAVGASVSVSVGILPSQLYFFGSVQTLAALVNVVALPYIAAVFIVTVCLTPLAAIPGCGAVLRACEYLLVPLDGIAYGVSRIPYSVFAARCSSAVFLCYPVMFFASDFFMIKKGRPSVVAYSAAACLVLMTVCML